MSDPAPTSLWPVVRRVFVLLAVVTLASLGLLSLYDALFSMWMTAFAENDLLLLDARVNLTLSAALLFLSASLGLTIAAVLRSKRRLQQPWDAPFRPAQPGR